MPELDHSKRNMERATYTPIRPPKKEEGLDRPGRAFDKWSYVARLAPTKAEYAKIKRRLMQGSGSVPQSQRKTLDSLGSVFAGKEDNETASPALENIPLFVDVPGSLLQRVGDELAKMRAEELKSSVETLETISVAYGKAAARGTTEPKPPRMKIPSDYAFDASFFRPELPGAKLYRLEGKPAPIKAAPGTEAVTAGLLPSPDAKGLHLAEGALLVKAEAPPVAAPAAHPAQAATLDQLERWALANKMETRKVAEALKTARRLQVDTSMTDLESYRLAVNDSLAMIRHLNYYLAQRLGTEPVGLLHLERISFVPAGIERGELVHSVPLSPGEEVNISHKEWSNTSEEFERIVTDYIEAYSEEGVTEKSELAQSTNSQHQHSSGFTLGVTASGSYGPVSVSATQSYNVAQSASRTESVARNHSRELTRKASSRVKKEHKISFKVASASGTEDQAVRKIVNPFQDKAVRVDYYQLVRKWRVDLYRYGVRLTYDVTIPEPGSDIISKILEVRALTAALQEGFGGTGSTLPWARFDITPDGVTRDNYLALAAQYGATVDPPPDDSYKIVKSFSQQWPNKDAAKKDEYTTFDVDVPADYEVTGWGLSWERWAWEDGRWHFTIRTDLNSWFGASGTLTMTIGTRLVSAFHIDLTLHVNLRPAAYKAWQLKTWWALREAAQARYELNRTMLKDRLSSLQEELGAQDALSLRKIEREEVMKNVLRWLFGPSFSFVAPGLVPELYGSSGAIVSDAVWSKVLAQGEVTKFLHQAIEWENMLYFLYPYFWSHTSRWEFKKYLDHPDFMHRAFLKSGSARVVLAVRPGFEKDFVSFLETGTLDALPPSHPYMTIAEETEAFANTNYPNIRAANPLEEARPLLSPLQKKAWQAMEEMIGLLEKYRETNGHYPTTEQGLAALSTLGAVPPADPWGNAWRYQAPGLYNDFELVSTGADGVPGGEGENADIVSWAEASLVGRWYDYAPTSALDIAFNETLPSA